MLLKLSKTLFTKRLYQPINRLDVRQSHFYAIKLSNKRLLRVSGEESFIYLQSLLSNDLRHLMDGQEVEPKGCVYAFLMSALGKVLADVFVYKGKLFSAGELILEVDSSLANALRRLLISYNINRKISVEAVNDIDLWTLIPKHHDIDFVAKNDFILKEVISDDIQLVNDPRLPQLGYRLLTRIGGKRFDDIIKFIDDKRIEEGNIGHYQSYRFKLGVAEGQSDLLSGVFFPFECNGDYLNAVSLDKGLYTSEEKVFNVYMKKPIIRRIMPVRYLCSETVLSRHPLVPTSHIGSKRSALLGTLRNRRGFNGIASLRVLYNLTPVNYDGMHDIESRIPMKTWYPEWWPKNINYIHYPEKDYYQNIINIVPL